MSQKPSRSLAELLDSADSEPFRGLSAHAIEDWMSAGDVEFLNQTLRESQAEIAAGLGLAPDVNYFSEKCEILKASEAKKSRRKL